MIEELLQSQQAQTAPVTLEEVVVATQYSSSENWKPRQRPFDSSPPVKVRKATEMNKFNSNPKE